MKVRSGPPDYLIGKRIGPLALDDAQGQHSTLLWLAKIKPLEQVGYRINSFNAISQACVDGLGLALIPCFLGDGHPGLRRVMPPVTELSLELWLLTHPDLRDTVRIKAVFQILQQELARLAARLAGAS